MRAKPLKHTIEVRHYPPGQSAYGNACVGKITGDFGNYTVIETIRRQLRAEQIGNFNPIFCTYKGSRMLVHSEKGDLSDPFRREEDYLERLFIVKLNSANE